MKRSDQRRRATDAPVVPGVEPLEPISRRTASTRQRLRRRTGSGDRALDERIRALVEGAGVENADLLEDLVQTGFRMARTANRGEMKLVSRSFRELGRAFRIFAPYRERRKVSIFGSARTLDTDPEYAIARDFAREIASRGWMVITGAGPGIMAAGHEGAGAGDSFGVGIKLPVEQGANGFIAGDPKLIDFKYFFTRKITFMKESDAFALLPGGYGTLDEAFELLTLMQTGKTAVRPIVLLEPPGSTYWSDFLRFVRDQLVARGLVSPHDFAFFDISASVGDAVARIERFYANYHSARYVGERLVIRLQRAPGPAAIARLNREYSDLVARGRIEAIAATAEEVRDGDVPALPRIALHATHDFARLRQLIDALNEL
ncbi:MAG TPA: TIGR00730 family Rossman fold protein [Dehalococcoidia bacterium]|nr:TIGR00730 family Rossman fold protein [Dehalococcoidia bacterium]